MCQPNSSKATDIKIINDFNSNEALEAVTDDKLPEELKAVDYPLFGLPHHIANIIFIVITHFSFVYYCFYLIPTQKLPWKTTTIGNIIIGYIGGLGITVGAHRYWTHKSFKANKPLQILMMLMQTLAAQHPIFKWCRDHRVHHKYTDTNADPHNSARGFWFSHLFWFLTDRHPDLVKSFKIVDLSDLARDPIVRFQSRHYNKLLVLVFFVIPMMIFHWLVPSLTFVQLFLATLSRFPLSLHFSSLVNSAAHLWGSKPYDKYISATDNKLVSILAVGEGWHNYHHTFPWDYKAAEFGYKYNLSTLFIDFFAWIGWAWDLKTVSHKLLVDRINRTGSKDHPFYKNHKDNVDENGNIAVAEKASVNDADDHGKIQNPCWGWGDRDMKKEDIDITDIFYQLKDQ